MMGLKARVTTVRHTVALDDLVPADDCSRHLDRVLDLAFVRDLVRDAYAPAGRPSIDPVVFFKLQLVMFFEGIRSERHLIETASLNLAHRWYLGYALDEELPDHSSLTRIRQRLGIDVFQRFFERIVDPTQRRLAVVRLHVEGWNATSIAAYLETSRQTVHTTLKRWAEEEFAGMPDKSRAPHRPATKVTLRAMATVKELQENPLLGEFRIHAALKRLGIFLSPRTCGRILALNRKLYGLPKPEPVPRDPKSMPFKAARRHQYWSADIRYLDHGLGDFKVYSFTILDNYSRAVVASGLSRMQDLGTFLTGA
jgi:transposase